MATWLKWVLGILGGVVMLLGVTWFNRTFIFWSIYMPMVMEPNHDFDPSTMAPLDYAEESHWASLPWREDDLSDQLPEGYEALDPAVDVDVFFIHPTSGLLGDDWNLTLEEEQSNELLHDWQLPGQTSAFTGCCNVYAPYYRQAIFFSFMEDGGANGELAIDAAYQDVRRAFLQFIDNWNGERPFVVAGHSQGSNHAIRLVQEEVLGTEHEARFIAAYMPGFRYTVASPITPCATDTQTGCGLGWNAFTEDADLPPAWRNSPVFHEGNYTREDIGSYVCNPPAPDAEDGYTGHFLGRGLLPSVSETECVGGEWRVEAPEDPALSEFQLTPGWLHVYEVAYTWVAIGEDVTRRTNAWAARQ